MGQRDRSITNNTVPYSIRLSKVNVTLKKADLGHVLNISCKAKLIKKFFHIHLLYQHHNDGVCLEKDEGANIF